MTASSPTRQSPTSAIRDNYIFDNGRNGVSIVGGDSARIEISGNRVTVPSGNGQGIDVETIDSGTSTVCDRLRIVNNSVKCTDGTQFAIARRIRYR